MVIVIRGSKDGFSSLRKDMFKQDNGEIGIST